MASEFTLSVLHELSESFKSHVDKTLCNLANPVEFMNEISNQDQLCDSAVANGAGSGVSPSAGNAPASLEHSPISNEDKATPEGMAALDADLERMHAENRERMIAALKLAMFDELLSAFDRSYDLRRDRSYTIDEIKQFNDVLRRAQKLKAGELS